MVYIAGGLFMNVSNRNLINTLKVRVLDSSTGNTVVAILNYKDASKLRLHRGDRIEIYLNKKNVVAIVDESISDIKEGEIGLNFEASNHIKANCGDLARIKPVVKPKSIYYIREKIEGKKLSGEKIKQIVSDIVTNRLSSVEITYFVSASYIRGLSLSETVSLTKAIYSYGEVLDFKKPRSSDILVDKHCIGGLAGNRTTPIIVPIVAASGLLIAKTSSRSITSPAGTADVIEALCDVCLSKDQIISTVKKTGACMVWGGSLALAPADDEIIRVEHPLSIDSDNQLVASVMAKKKSVSSDVVLIDIPIGPYAKVKNKFQARKLKFLFEFVGKHIGIKTNVIYTDGRNPIGKGIGPSLEARDVLRIFENHEDQPLDLRDKALSMAGLLIEMGGKAKKGEGINVARELLESGKALNKFIEILKTQGERALCSNDIEIASYVKCLELKSEGRIKLIRNDYIAETAKVAGAPKDKLAGVYIRKQAGDLVKKGEVVIEIHSQSKHKLDSAVKFFNEHIPFVM